MSAEVSPHRWEDVNRQYLTAALEWLRLRLVRLAPGGAAGVPEPSDDATKQWWSGLRTRQSGPDLPNGVERSRLADTQVTMAGRAVAAVEAEADPPPALVILSRRFGLSRFEQHVLLLCAAMELDTRIAPLCARAQDDPARPYPTFALALTLFDDPAWEALSPHRPLRYWRLIEIHQPGALPLTTSPLRADERIVSYLKGLNDLDDRLTPLLQDVNPAATDVLPPSQQRTVDLLVEALQQVPAGSRLPVIQLLGSDSSSKRLIAARAARTLGLHLYRLPVTMLPPHPSEMETLARLWQRESALLPIGVLIDAHDPEASQPAESQPSAAPMTLLRRFVGRLHGVVLVDTRDVVPGLADGHTVALDVSKPTPAEQQAAWYVALGPQCAAAAALAGQFNLGLDAIHRIGATAGAVQARRDEMAAALWRTCLVHTRPRLDALAQRLEPKATWDDLVLPAEEMERLREIGNQVRQRRTVYDDWGFRGRMNRGLGISALFAGESGTGKTMAAEVIANDLQLNLYRIDLSGVVSKYIGETEKNLRQLFDAAEDGGAILLFDEADALFGKRSDVKDSHDRYANIEVNYLLQRIEAFAGVAVLATNMKSALDPAFVRRLRFIVNFPYPGPDERRKIWEHVFPADTPLGRLDFARLARLNLTGASIHSIALNAAFLAARAGTPVTMPLVLNAARTELRKLERPINESELRSLEAAAGPA